jgi:maltooligosyltrehalose trehalohydrolase
MPFGAEFGSGGDARFRLWAPACERVGLEIEGQNSPLPLTALGEGWHEVTTSIAKSGARYRFVLSDGTRVPDPASRYQPDDVHGASELIDSRAWKWNDAEWRGRRWEEAVIYELHVGAFTPEGTFAAAVSKLDHLASLGVTAIEIMPVGDFPGNRNWGYDGVLPYAAQNSYGGPRGLQRLVDACHGHGLAVYLDVVYNHFGPESNYLGEFGPYFSDRYKTPWGEAVNYDRSGCDAVRDFVLDNVRMWLEEFHFDGLRLDAVDMIFDLGARHILRAIKEVAEAAGERRGWPAVVTAESDLNDPRLLYPAERGGHALDAQWMDDYHHAAHAFFSGERHGYYGDFGEALQLGKILEQPFLYAGEYSRFRDRKHGARAEGLAGDRFIVFLQNHDQVGNRASGDRLNTLMKSPAKQRLAASYLLLSPYLPLLFMGEEYGEENPFPFFCSFRGEELVRAVRDGRRRDYSHHDQQSEVPDPGAEATFASARLSWSWPEGTARAGLRCLYRDLLTARREWPALRDFVNRSARLVTDGDGGMVLELIRGTDSSNAIIAFFNLAERDYTLPADVHAGRSVLFSSQAMAYSGSREQFRHISEILPFECIVFGPASWRSFQ